MGDLYAADVLEWSEHQARLLRDVAAGKLSNEAPDWANIIEEIESVGSSQLATVRSQLARALEHDLKCRGWPDAPYVEHWRAEIRRFRADAADSFSSSMRQRIDMAALFKRARRIMPTTIDGQPPLPLPDACPFTLDELLSDEA